MSTVDQRIKALQARIGVPSDGVLGPVTLTRLEEIVEDSFAARASAPAAAPFSLLVSHAGLDRLVQFEISSEANYRARLSKPIWPGAASGVTIGIGYDLGHTSVARIEADWRGRIRDADLDRLLVTQGVKGEAARGLPARLSDVVVPLDAARGVFYERTLPHFAAVTRKAYPGVEALPADAQAMLLSLVFNRGAQMSGPTRVEMKAIQNLVPARDLAGIAAQVRAMKRLWDPAKLLGLHKRRDAEAALIVASDRPYDPAELVRL